MRIGDWGGFLPLKICLAHLGFFWGGRGVSGDGKGKGREKRRNKEEKKPPVTAIEPLSCKGYWHEAKEWVEREKGGGKKIE